MPLARGCVALKAASASDLPPILPLLCICLYNLFLTYCILFCGAVYDVSSNYQAQRSQRNPPTKRKQTPLVLHNSEVDVLKTIHSSSAVRTNANICASVECFPLCYGVVLMKVGDFTVLVFMGSRRHEIDCLDKRFQLPTETIKRPVPFQSNRLIGIKLLWKKKRQSQSRALRPRFGSSNSTWLAVCILDPESSIDDLNTLFFKELNLARQNPGWPRIDTTDCGESRYIPQPICVPWASPSLRQNIIAEVLSNFMCISMPDAIHDFMQCYTPNQGTPKSFKGGALDSTYSRFKLSSASVRSLAGGSSRSSDQRTVTNSGSKTTPSKRSSAKGKKAAAKQPWDEDGESNSDEDHADKSRAPKRKRGETPSTKKGGLPCIFHVSDPARHTWGEWKHCNPNVSSYSDPSALM